MAPPRNPVQLEKFTFGEDFQKTLIRMVCEDDDFAHAVSRFLKPEHFTGDILHWAFSEVLAYREKYNCSPSLNVILERAKSLDPKVRDVYIMGVEAMRVADVKDRDWLRDQVLDFIKRTNFVRTFRETLALFNSGKVNSAYDIMRERMDVVDRLTWEPADESLFFEDLPRRHAQRMRDNTIHGAVPTGFPFLDKVLNGGLSPGEMGIWIAYPKHGKSTMLANLGKNAVNAMRPTIHFVLEGSRSMVEDRYDAALMDELYGNVKTGEVDAKKYNQAFKHYQVLKGMLIIRGMTERFDYSVADLQEGLDDVKRRHGFVPHLVVVDYGDLLQGRDFKRGYKSETEKQKAAFRDLKILASRGYALWTASQAQRPREGAEDKVELLKSRSIADCYEKVRVADFLGSLNQTLSERRADQMRLYAELYRENEADVSMVVQSEFKKMRIRQVPGLKSVNPDPAKESESIGLNYKQAHAPV